MLLYICDAGIILTTLFCRLGNSTDRRLVSDIFTAQIFAVKR